LRTAARVFILRQRSASGKIIQVARQAGARESHTRKAPPWSDGAKVVILDGRVGERRRPHSFWRADGDRQGNETPAGLSEPAGLCSALQAWSRACSPFILARLTGTGKRRSSPVWKVVAAVPIRKRRPLRRSPPSGGGPSRSAFSILPKLPLEPEGLVPSF
jgi:hypothetical protein